MLNNLQVKCRFRYSRSGYHGYQGCSHRPETRHLDQPAVPPVRASALGLDGLCGAAGLHDADGAGHPGAVVRAVPVRVLRVRQVLLVAALTAVETCRNLAPRRILGGCGYSRCMPETLTAALHREEDWYIAQCLEVDVASQGRTIDEALANLAEAVELYLEEVEDPAGHLTATPLVTSFKLPAA
jgi:predicted RNase H-like HicB family nuclease